MCVALWGEEMKKAKRASVCVCGTVGGGDEEG